MANRTPQTIAEAIMKFTSVSYKARLARRRSYDNWFWKQWLEDKKNTRLRLNQKLDIVAHQNFGSDLAVAKFIVTYCQGKVKNQEGKWIAGDKDLPQSYDSEFKLVAIDAQKASLISEGIDNFVGLDHVESINLSENPKLDDCACDQLARQFRRSKTLQALDLSYNPFVSVYGLDVLFRIPSLKKIIAIGTQASKYEDIDLFTLAAQDERQCEVFVHKDGRQYVNDELERLRTQESVISSSQ